MTELETNKFPIWADPNDELPHDAPDIPLWNETYVSMAYSPSSEVGVWVHLRHVPEVDGHPDMWDAVFYAALPDDNFLVARSLAPGLVERAQTPGVGQLRTAGITWEWKKPFEEWVLRYRGGMREVTGTELRSGPLQQGPHVSVELELHSTALSGAWDHGTDSIKSSWGKAHYQQHQEGRGFLAWNGSRIDIDGGGHRDHSWGPRNFSHMGNTTWLQGRIPEKGRAFAITYVPARSGYPEMVDPTVTDRNSLYRSSVVGSVPEAFSLEEALEEAELSLRMPDSSVSTMRFTPLTTMPMHFQTPSEFVPGAPRGITGETHHNVLTFARIDWDGEVCYGFSERNVLLSQPSDIPRE